MKKEQKENINHIRSKETLKDFREEHECRFCWFYKRPGYCKGEGECLLERLDDEEKRKRLWRRQKREKQPCPYDQKGNCPYGNEVGTCFGFCMQRILEEHHKKKEAQSDG